MNIGIYGYGNLGRGVEDSIKRNPDMNLVAVFTRRNPETVKILTQNVPVYHIDKALELKESIDVKDVDALSLAKEAGNIKAVNVVLIGVMAKSTDIPYEKWIETIKTTVPPKFLEVNIKAFELGYNM